MIYQAHENPSGSSIAPDTQVKMKFLSLCFLSFLAKTLAQSYGGFPKASGTQFTIDGTTGYFAGGNAYWLGFQSAADAEAVMAHVAGAGLKVLRVWGFNDVNATPSPGTVWYQSLVPGQAPVVNTGADGLQRLDAVVAAAEKHDVKLIIPFVNSWDDYGGIKAYTTAFGGDHVGWFTNAEAQAAYTAYAKAVVSRYPDSAAIFAWELANEIRCNGCNPGVVHDWAANVSSRIKGWDANRMVTLGDEGFNPGAGDGSYPYGTSEGVAFARNLDIPDLDFGTFHMYPSAWGADNTDFPPAWIAAHAAACKAASKPCLFEEYGVMEGDKVAIAGPWQQKSLSLKADGMGGDLLWQVGDQISTGKTPDDGYTVYYGTPQWTSLVDDHVAAVKGG